LGKTVNFRKKLLRGITIKMCLAGVFCWRLAN